MQEAVLVFYLNKSSFILLYLLMWIKFILTCLMKLSNYCCVLYILQILAPMFWRYLPKLMMCIWLRLCRIMIMTDRDLACDWGLMLGTYWICRQIVWYDDSIGSLPCDSPWHHMRPRACRDMEGPSLWYEAPYASYHWSYEVYHRVEGCPYIIGSHFVQSLHFIQSNRISWGLSSTHIQPPTTSSRM